MQISTGQADALLGLDGLDEADPGPCSGRFHEAPFQQFIERDAVFTGQGRNPWRGLRQEGIACQRHHVFDGFWLAWNRHAEARVATAYHPSTPTARFKDRRRSPNHVFPAAAPPGLAVQDEVRAAFGWSVEDDQDSALALHAHMSAVAPYGVENWAAQARDAALRDLVARCRAASRVVVVGAAAALEAENAAAGPETIFIAADGAARAVSDVQRGVTVVLHAHGDNREAWENHLATWAEKSNPPRLVLTHQVPEAIEGMHNPGGFTDGDRAVCLLRWMGIEDEHIAFVGFAMD
ncbi:MAG: hypothetical protein VXB94_13850, partial [Rhodobiaceae bacterium]